MKENLLIIGAGQFGQVTKEIAETTNNYNKIDFLDDNSNLAIDKIENYDKYKNEYNEVIIAIGNAKIRKELTLKIEKYYKLTTIISPFAYISKSAIIEKGCIIEPNTLINANSIIKKSSIICAGAIINHNAIVESYCHINCNAVVKSNSIINEFTKLDYGQIL